MIGRKRSVATLAGCAVTALLAACEGHVITTSTAPAQATAQALHCQQLLGLPIAASHIGLPTSGAAVTEAVLVAASGAGAAAVGEHCLVTGHIAPVDRGAPDIRFRVALPTVWNAKAVMFGGGGFNGTIPNVVGNVPNGPTDHLTPLGRGYATFASDSGHQANALDTQDGSFNRHDEAARNYSGDALKKTRDVAVALIKARYAAGEPSKSYFAGGSTGGREALVAIQRWPADWDGAIAWYPALNDAALLLSGHRVTIAMSQPGAYPNAAKRKLVYQAALAACDMLDGVADGLISNPVQCNASFNPTTALLNGVPLRCTGGADRGDSCLSDPQIKALKLMDSPIRFNFFMASGETQYPGYNVWGADLGISTSTTGLEWVVSFLNLGSSAPAMPMPTTAPYISVVTDQWIKHAVTGDAAFNSLLLDPENPGPWAGRISAQSTLLDTRSDITAFAARGGKLLLAHGQADALVSTRATEQYVQRLQAQMGPTAVDRFVRYYEVPGMGHAVSTQFNATWDSLTALEQWAEKGVAPAGQVTTDTVGVPGRTRPLCDYPTWPRYKGTGDVNAAASFVCVEARERR